MSEWPWPRVGLSVIIIVTDQTTIIRVDFAPGGCSDIVAGKEVSVRGSNESGGIQATEIGDSVHELKN
jgi:hypothetical protein